MTSIAPPPPWPPRTRHTHTHRVVALIALILALFPSAPQPALTHHTLAYA